MCGNKLVRVAECVWVLSPTVSKGQLGVLNSQDLRNRIAVVLRGEYRYFL